MAELSKVLEKLGSLHDDAAEAIGNPDQVWCRECGRTEPVDAAHCLRKGWPMCCGYTMTIDSPEE